MRQRDLYGRKQQLDALFKKISSFSGDIEIQAHWARYLCVLVSGYIEDSIRTIYIDYTRTKSSPQVGNYVAAQLNGFTNAKMGKILALIGQFDDKWRSDMEQILDAELKDAVDSIVSQRHEIAHGRSSNITFQSVSDYYERVLKALELIEKQCT